MCRYCLYICFIYSVLGKKSRPDVPSTGELPSGLAENVLAPSPKWFGGRTNCWTESRTGAHFILPGQNCCKNFVNSTLRLLLSWLIMLNITREKVKTRSRVNDWTLRRLAPWKQEHLILAPKCSKINIDFACITKITSQTQIFKKILVFKFLTILLRQVDDIGLWAIASVFQTALRFGLT